MHKHRILLLDTKNFNPNRYLVMALWRAFCAHPDVEAARVVTYRNAFEAAYELKPDALVIFGGEEVDDFILQRLKDLCGQTIIWYTEDPYENRQNIRTSAYADFVFTNDADSVNLYKKAAYLPLAACREFHYFPAEPDKRCYDLFFAGSPWPNRIEMLSGLLKHDDGLRIKLIMPRAFEAGLPKGSAPNLSLVEDTISGLDYARFTARSNATLYLTRDYSTTPGARTMTRSPGPRFFESALAGGIQIYPKGSVELPAGFTDNVNAIPFETVPELLSIVRSLEDTDRWKTMAEASQQATLSFHTYGHRAQSILDVLK